MRKVRLRVVTETQGQQVPWSADALLLDGAVAGPSGL